MTQQHSQEAVTELYLGQRPPSRGPPPKLTSTAVTAPSTSTSTSTCTSAMVRNASAPEGTTQALLGASRKRRSCSDRLSRI